MVLSERVISEVAGSSNYTAPPGLGLQVTREFVSEVCFAIFYR